MVLLGGLEIVAVGYVIHKHNKNKKERQRLEEEEAQIHAAMEKEKERQRRRRSKSRERRDGKSGKKYHYSADERRDDRHRPAKPVLMQNPQMLAGPPPYAQVAGQTSAAGPSYPLPSQTQPPHPFHPDIKYGWTDESAPAPAPRPSAHDPSFPPTGWPQHWPQSQSPDPHARRNGRDKSETRVRWAVPGTTQPGEEGGRSGRGRRRDIESSESESPSPPPSYKS